MKFSIAAIFATAISAVCAQTSASAAPAAPANAGIATTHPSLGVSSNIDQQKQGELNASFNRKFSLLANPTPFLGKRELD